MYKQFNHEGIVHHIGDLQQFSEKFWKQELVIKINQQYGDKMKVIFVKDKCNIIRSLNPGDFVRVHFTIDGRYWQKDDRDGYITDLNGEDCELLRAHGESPPATEIFEKEDPLPPELDAPPPTSEDLVPDGAGDTLPF